MYYRAVQDSRTLKGVATKTSRKRLGAAFNTMISNNSILLVFLSMVFINTAWTTPVYGQSLKAGYAKYVKGDFSGALQAYDTALRLHPYSLNACNNQGIALRRAGQLKKAETALEKAIYLQIFMI